MGGVSAATVSVVLFSERNSKFGYRFLGELLATPGIAVRALVTSPPAAPPCSYYVGEPDPVDLIAEGRRHGLPVLRPDSVNDAGFVATLRDLAPDYALIANFQQIFKAALLDVPATGTVNFHPSPLPRYAGLAPFFWMAKLGEREGGVSAIVTDQGIDSGPVLAQTPIALTATETADEIRAIHFDESVRLLRRTLPMLRSRCLRGAAQDHSRRTYFGSPGVDDCTLDWSAGCEAALRTFRAAHPRPGVRAYAPGGHEVRVLSARRVGRRELGRRRLALSIPGSPLEETLVQTPDGWLAVELQPVESTVTSQCLVDNKDAHTAVLAGAAR